jgi:hypothetical protein
VSTGDFKNGTNLVGGIVGQVQLGTSATALLTTSPVAAGSYVKVAKVVLCNTSASAVTVTYGAVKSGGTLVDAATACKTFSLGAAGSNTHTLDATELAGMMLGPGDFLSGLASTGAVVTATVSGAVSS